MSNAPERLTVEWVINKGVTISAPELGERFIADYIRADRYVELMGEKDGQTFQEMKQRIKELERRWNNLPWEEMENHIEWWDRPTRSLEIILKILAAREEGNE